jgi:hypothetical protein
MEHSPRCTKLCGSYHALYISYYDETINMLIYNRKSQTAAAKPLLSKLNPPSRRRNISLTRAKPLKIRHFPQVCGRIR